MNDDPEIVMTIQLDVHKQRKLKKSNSTIKTLLPRQQPHQWCEIQPRLYSLLAAAGNQYCTISWAVSGTISRSACTLVGLGAPAPTLVPKLEHVAERVIPSTLNSSLDHQPILMTLQLFQFGNNPTPTAQRPSHSPSATCTPVSVQQKSTPNLSPRTSESSDVEPDSTSSKKQESSDTDKVLLNALDF